MKAEETSLKGLYKVTLDVYPDERGTFRESWQAAKFAELGLPDFRPVQQNIAVSKKGALRGIHAEPWEKLVHMAQGEAFAAFVDLREDSETFGQVETVLLDEQTAMLVPRGFGNSYQVLTEQGAYCYLVTAHWSPTPYPAIAFDDPDLAIAWPLPDEAIISEKDRNNPTLRSVYPHKFN